LRARSERSDRKFSSAAELRGFTPPINFSNWAIARLKRCIGGENHFNGIIDGTT
jgi:hypothetical protein